MKDLNVLFRKFLIKLDDSCLNYSNKEFILEKNTRRYNVSFKICKIPTRNCDNCIFYKEWDCKAEGVTIVETIKGASCNKFTTTQGPVYVKPVEGGGPEKRFLKKILQSLFN